MSIATRIESIEDHIRDIYDTLEIAGSDLTDVNKNIVNINVELIDRLIYYINNGIGTVIANWPKATGSGSSITLNDTIVAPLQDLKLNPSELSQDGTPSPAESETVHTISGNNTITISDGTNAINYSITLGDIEYCKIGTYQDTIFKSSGKNLFDGNLSAGYFITSTKTLTSTTSTIFKSFTIDLKAGTYTLSCNTKINIVRAFTDYDTSNDIIFSDAYTNINSYTMTLTQDTKLYISVRRNDNTNWLDTDLIQLEKGNQATSYEPYGTDWYIKKEIGKVVLDGSESGWTRSIDENKIVYFLTMHSLPSYNYKIIKYQKYCNNFIYENTAWRLATSPSLCENTDSGNLLIFRYDDISTTADWKDWLSTHNTIVYYVLNTPTYTILSNTLQTELDNLFNAKSKDNQTIITQTNNDLPFIIDVKALTKLGDDE